jgi:phage RecT family recombinase
MTTELILPPAKNPGTQIILDKQATIETRLPPNVNPQNFMTAVVTEMNSLTRPCTPASIAIAAFNCAVLGLIPGSALGHAYFIPYKGVCTLIPGYKGFLDLAYGNKFLKSVHCDVVLRGEEFDYWKDETGPKLKHLVSLERNLTRDNVMATYCIYHTALGGHGIVLVNKKELNKIDTEKNVWKSDYVSMAKKTAVRRAAKEWKITPSLGLAIQLDEQAERGDTQTADPSFGNIEDLTAEPESSFSLSGDGEKPKSGYDAVREAVDAVTDHDSMKKAVEVLVENSKALTEEQNNELNQLIDEKEASIGG